jgi:two-component system osmolarity sensor histidine kinase EnvZ
MDQVIGQFLDFARDETEEKTEADLAVLLAEIGEHYALLGRKVTVRASPLAPFAFAHLALRRAISNLVENALRYAGEPVDVEARREGARIVIEVLDRGRGIPEGEAERLKRPFTRLDEARSGRGGAGLGLAIVERVARTHGGRLELLPRPGGGLTARLSLGA